jgi:hypothetical protein
MKLWKSVTISILILAILFILAVANYNKFFYILNEKYCEKDSDCKEFVSCHDTEAVNKFHKPQPGGCTDSLGPLKLGCGKVLCVNSKCIVEKNANYSWCQEN